MSSLSLRARLIITLVSLMSVALVVSDVASVTALRSYLLDKVDQELADARVPLFRGLRTGAATITPRQTDRPANYSNYYVEFFRADGTVETLPSSVRSGDAPPDLSADVVARHVGTGPFTVDAQGDGTFDYRAVVTRSPDDLTTLSVVAIPLEDVDSTVRRLVLVEVFVTTGVLGIMVLLGWYLVRNDMKPLDDMTDTAAAIAAGDLSQRVSRADEHTEVGRLGQALNTMLTQIETSFAAKAASEERLRRFAADASHELRTPLTAIRGYAELYRQGAITDDEHLQRVMHRVEGEATRMGVMVNDLLLLARLDQGRPLEADRVDLGGIVTNVVHDARVIADDRTIDVVLPPEPITMTGDSGRLHQVFANLVGNAHVHTPPGTTVHVTLEREGHDAVVSVRDEGAGLDEEAATKVFERFYRVDTGRSRAEGGTGLGLAIVKAIVESHGGTVSATSSPGEGATFTVRLPLTSHASGPEPAPDDRPQDEVPGAE